MTVNTVRTAKEVSLEFGIPYSTLRAAGQFGRLGQSARLTTQHPILWLIDTSHADFLSWYEKYQVNKGQGRGRKRKEESKS